MSQEALNVERLLSQARNPAHGQTDKGLVPTRVFNLVPDRMGGYVPFGRRSELMTPGPDSEQVTLNATDRLIGIDESGISSFHATNDALRLYRGRSLHTSQATYARAGEAVHLDGAGAYLSRDEYLVLSRELNGNRIPVEPLVGASAGAQPGEGSPLSHGEVGEFNGLAREVAFGAGDFMLITDWKIWRYRGGSWREVYHAADEDHAYLFTRVAFSNGVWLVSRTGPFAGATETFLRSTDGGDSWTEVTPANAPDIRITAIAGGPDALWLAAGYRKATGTVVVMHSIDGGNTWLGGASRTQVPGHVVDMKCLVANGNPDFHLFTDHHSSYADTWVHNPLSGYFEVYWYYALRKPGSWPLSPGNGFKLRGPVVAAASSGQVAMASVSASGVMDLLPFPAPGLGVGVGRLPGHFTESGGTIHPRDLAWETHAGDPGAPSDPRALVAVGHFWEDGATEPQPRVWRNQSNSYSRWGDAERAFPSNASVASVANDDQGNFMMVSERGTWVFSGASQGLQGGNYNVYIVSYFNTHAGKFVYDMQTTSISTEDGGFIDFFAPNKAYILDQNPWMVGREDILDDLRFDVYVQRVGEPILGEDVAYTIRYAFTESFPGTTSDTPSLAVPVNRSISALPLGRQFLTHGEPTTAVFEKRHTALHNGRVWGLASQDEDLWPNDIASPEIANQHQRFVLSYTEIGWANLISDRSWIVIQPTQSTRFTGLLSTPSGLLVMFENEIHLVTGDPAFGNVSVELYLDMVGHDPPRQVDGEGNPISPPDPGPHPCKVGGVPFVIWNGKIWVLQAGQAQQIGAEQWLRNDPFVRISPEPQTRSLLALTESGSVFRYMLDDQFWLTDPVTRTDTPVLELLTNCACETGDNTRFVVAHWEEGYNALWSTRSDGAPDAPHVLYRDIDFGALDSRSALYLVKVGVEGPLLTEEEFRRDAPGFNAGRLPTLHFLAANEGDEDILDPSPLAPVGILPYLRSNDRRSNTITWRLPLARTRGSSIDVRLELRGFTRDDTLKLPLQLFFASGGVVR